MQAEARIRNRAAIHDMERKSGPYYERYVERMARSFVKSAVSLGYRVLNREPWIEKVTQ